MKIGFVAGTWDLLHAGHVHLLSECKLRCDFLYVGLHVNPQLERKEKNKPIESLVERVIKLRGCKYVDRIIPYETEYELALILKHLNPDVRFLGSDYLEVRPITEPNLVPIKYINSLPIHTTDIRKRIKK